jgi:hypothetical protein
LRQSTKTILIWLILIVVFVSVYNIFTDSSSKTQAVDANAFNAKLAAEAKARLEHPDQASQEFELIRVYPGDRQDAKFVINYRNGNPKGVVHGTWGDADSRSRTWPASTRPRRSSRRSSSSCGPAEVHQARRPHPQGRAAGRPAGHRQDAARRAVAGEAGVPFFSISGSDFVEMFVGVGASRVRDLFEQGKKNAPCIIFIDEIDAVGRHRGAGLGGGHDEREQTLNQLLVEMDGFESNEGVILIAATNRPDVLDPALLRPGRFDRQVVVPRPTCAGREGSSRCTPARCRWRPTSTSRSSRAARRASRAPTSRTWSTRRRCSPRAATRTRSTWDFEDAKDKVLMGAERRSMVMTEEEKKTTAYHEAGHALVARSLPGHDPVHKVTIIPRGRRHRPVARGQAADPAAAGVAQEARRRQGQRRQAPGGDAAGERRARAGVS